MKLYTTKHGDEGPEIYVSNSVVLIALLIFIAFGTLMVTTPQEKIQYEREVICK